MLEKKKMGELEMSGSWDVLSLALETPEHTGRVRGVGDLSPEKHFSICQRQGIESPKLNYWLVIGKGMRRWIKQRKNLLS